MDTGTLLPDLEFSLSSGETARFSDYAGRWLVVYFYPKDHTPGCTVEAGNFRDLMPRFKEANAEILGVSRDSAKTHQNFINKQCLPFDLIADTDEVICRTFDVIKEKTMYGRKVMGIVRSTFLIDPEQRVVQAWRGVKVPGHAQAVLDHLTHLQSS